MRKLSAAQDRDLRVFHEIMDGNSSLGLGLVSRRWVSKRSYRTAAALEAKGLTRCVQLGQAALSGLFELTYAGRNYYAWQE